jgi:hypothetical protein
MDAGREGRGTVMASDRDTENVAVVTGSAKGICTPP